MHACTPSLTLAHTYARTHAHTHTYIDTYGKTNERTDGRTDRETRRQTYTPFLFLTFYFLVLTSQFLVLTSYFLLLSSYFLLLISYILLPSCYLVYGNLDSRTDRQTDNIQIDKQTHRHTGGRQARRSHTQRQTDTHTHARTCRTDRQTYKHARTQTDRQTCTCLSVCQSVCAWGISRCRSQHVSVESSSLLHHSIYLWFICFTCWSIDELENLHADCMFWAMIQAEGEVGCP